MVEWLSKNWKRKSLLIHRLVALTFIQNTEDKPLINHIDWNKQNNTIENLEWCTASENQIHCYKFLWRIPSCKWKTWIDSNQSKKINQYNKQWNFIKNWDSMWDIERELWIFTWNISWCCNLRKSYHTAWWFIWKYA